MDQNEEPKIPLIDLVSRLVKLETVMPPDLVSRLARLETSTPLEIKELDKNFCLHRTHTEREADAIRASMERRNDEIKNYFVVEIKAVYAQIDGLKKMVYIGLGIVTALSALLKFVGK